MGTLAYALRRAIELILYPFDLLPPWLGLLLISIATGAAMLWLVGKTTRQRNLERARDRMASSIYEVRLFLDSPLRVLVAQGRLLRWGGVYVAHLLPALLIMTIPLGLLYLQLEIRHGLAPLSASDPVVVRISLDDDVDGYQISAAPEQDGLSVTAPPLFAEDDRLVYLRVRIDEPGERELRIQAGDEVVTKKLSADESAAAVAPERVRGAAGFLAYGTESPLPGGVGVAGIEIAHPDREQSWLGLGVPWWLFWLVVATIAALALRRPMGVVL